MSEPATPSPDSPPSARDFTAAVVQMNSAADREANLVVAEGLLADAVRQGAELLVLPENFSYMGRTEAEKRQSREDPDHGPSLTFLREFARRHHVWLVGGSIPLATGHGEGVTNTCFLVGADGEVHARYDKIHLFDVDLADGRPFRESAIITPGREPVVGRTPFGVIGLSICYDLRFPELYRRLVTMGATLLTVPAAFTSLTGPDHWELLLRARAVENLAYVLAPGQWGHHPGGRRTYGHSLIVEPWGLVTGRCPEGVGVALARIEPDRVLRLRSRIPCLDHRVLG
ncbi:MAG: carbon-nitrogen hydrolase family protein [Magnetococcales bacterium]|nr:carbon-nitrogen hydrolase family protein [Magnetococcales bacterium]